MSMKTPFNHELYSSQAWLQSLDVLFHSVILVMIKDFPGGSDGKESARNAGDLRQIPGQGGSPGEGKGYLLQYSGLENPMVAESDTTEGLSLSLSKADLSCLISNAAQYRKDSYLST